MRIVLSDTPREVIVKHEKIPYPPLNIAYLAQTAIENGFDDIELLETELRKMTVDQAVEYVVDRKPDAFGITLYSDNRFSGFDFANRVKQALPDTLVMGGGPHVAFANHAEEVLRHVPGFDVITRGEGELTFIDILKNAPERTFNQVLGISYRDGERIVSNPNRPNIKELVSLPRPARRLLDIPGYHHVIDALDPKCRVRATTLITSRGCPFQCIFCSCSKIWGHKWRMNSAENVLAEMEHLLATYPEIRGFEIVDDTFTVDRERLTNICDGIIEKKWNIYWGCGSRVDVMTREMLEYMYRAGLRAIGFGVESGDQEFVNKTVKKSINLEKVKQIDQWCHELGIRALFMFIVSLPGETHKEALATLNFMKQLKGVTSLNALRIYPGTEVESLAKKNGVLPENFSWIDRQDASYHSVFPQVFGNVPHYFENMTFEEVAGYLFAWAKQSNYPFRKKLVRFLKSLKTKEDFKNAFIFLKSYIRVQLGARGGEHA